MKRCVVLLTFLFFFSLSLKALSQDMYDWINIDCGSSTSYPSDEINWQTDDKFISTGTNKQVSTENFGKWVQMNTLRSFTQQNKNCYTLPTTSSDRYFIRATFNYGNYDGLSNPPTFYFQIDGNKIDTIETSLASITYVEVIHTSRGDNISVCLARVRDQEYPFISTLEALPLGDKMYGPMSRDLAWVMSYRYDYGTEDWTLGYPTDNYNRWWEPAPPQDLNSRLANTTTLDYNSYEDPPESVVFDAAEAQSLTDSIILSFPINKANSLNYILLYFTEITELVDSTRSFDVYVNDIFIINSIPEFQNCTEVNTYAHPEGNLTVELRPTTDSGQPPIISAIEVYTASDTLVTVGTSQDDLDGLSVIIRTFFGQLKGWSGEPCLPNDTTWQWLGCAGNNPPRVTALNLSGYGLVGSLPNFSVMQELESIDLSNNNLDGTIPNFFGKLPNLKLLDLRRNNFSGEIPWSIVSNKNIKLSVDPNVVWPKSPPDNQPDNQPHKKAYSAGHIIGIIIGVLAGIGIVISLVLYLRRKIPQTGGSQVPVPDPEPEQQQQQHHHHHHDASGSFNASTDPMIRPHQNGNHTGNGNGDQPVSGGAFVPVHGGAGEAGGHSSNMEPDMDMHELDNLVQEHVNQR